MTDAAGRLSRLMDGYLTTQLLRVAAELGIADALAGRPQTTEALAAAVDARPEPLRRCSAASPRTASSRRSPGTRSP